MVEQSERGCAVAVKVAEHLQTQIQRDDPIGGVTDRQNRCERRVGDGRLDRPVRERPPRREARGGLLKKAGLNGVTPAEFRRYGSARKLYNFNIDNADAY